MRLRQPPFNLPRQRQARLSRIFPDAVCTRLLTTLRVPSCPASAVSCQGTSRHAVCTLHSRLKHLYSEQWFSAFLCVAEVGSSGIPLSIYGQRGQIADCRRSAETGRWSNSTCIARKIWRTSILTGWLRCESATAFQACVAADATLSVAACAAVYLMPLIFVCRSWQTTVLRHRKLRG